MVSFLFEVATLASIVLQSAHALPTISVNGAKFFAGGQQFFLKGVAYQGTPSDPLVDTNQCELDVEYMKDIGINSIRVYHVDPTQNHDGCMQVLSKAGIYLWLDLDTFSTTVVQTAPQWTQTQFVAFAKVMDCFQGYDNLGGFWIGNEVINSASGSSAAPYVKAAVADMKAYMAAKNYRDIPIGYSAADIAELRPMLQNYLACGDPSTSIDFFGLNSYEWCGDATYQTSGYSNLQAMSQGYSIPIFFSETGCNVGGSRTFQDQNAIFGPEMIDTWSGAMVYEWVEEVNKYGLVTYRNGQIYNGAPIPIIPDYTNLETVWANIHPTGIAEESYTPSFTAPACPMSSNGWAVNGDVPLPTLGASVVGAVAASQLITYAPSTSTSSSTSAIQALAMSTAGTTPSVTPVFSQTSGSSASTYSKVVSTSSAGQGTSAVFHSQQSSPPDTYSVLVNIASTTTPVSTSTSTSRIFVSHTVSSSPSGSTSNSTADRTKIPTVISHLVKSLGPFTIGCALGIGGVFIIGFL